MLGMTFLAFFFFLHQAVVASLVSYILRYIFVTVFTKPGLCCFVELFVATATITFVFDMSLDYRSG